jgi:hypothetical protein
VGDTRVQHFRGRNVRLYSVLLPATAERYVRHGASLWFPGRVTVFVRDARYPVRLDISFEEGRPVCSAIARLEAEALEGRESLLLDDGTWIRRGPPLTTGLLRLPLERIVKDIAAELALETRRIPVETVDPLRQLEQLQPDEQANVVVALPAYGEEGGLDRARDNLRTRSAPPVRRGRRVSHEEIEEAAQLAAKARIRGRSEIEAVKKGLHVSRSTAIRRLKEARKLEEEN